jgi:hypothetical protein
MKYVYRSLLYAPLTFPTHNQLLGGRQTTREVATPRHMHNIQATHSGITFRRSLPTIQSRINKFAVHKYMQVLPALLLHPTPIYSGTTAHFVTADLFRVHLLLNSAFFIAFSILHCFRHSNVSRSYFAITLHCSRLHCWLGRAGPQTISQSSSPNLFKFSHVPFKYARVFTNIGTSISGEEAVETETISNTFYIRDGMGLSHSNAWPGTASTSYK